MEATVHLDTRQRIGPIDRRIFGGFIEHMGRAVYEGIYDPGSPFSDERGFRTDVMSAITAMNMPLMRYPGGNFVSGYDWRDGVGPRAQRPVRADSAWQSLESNHFGTDEFVAWCRAVDTAPVLAVNLGTGSIESAAALVEYCNLPPGTYWTDRRASNASEEPYGVGTWCLGNEMDGPWQAGHVPARVYAEKALAAGSLMKQLDDSIELIVCGSSSRNMGTYMEWDRTVLEHCWDSVDYISAHRYTAAKPDTPSYLAEGVVIDQILADYRGLISYVRALKASSRSVQVSFDEWNVWRRNYDMKGGWSFAPHLLEEEYTFEDALVIAQYLNSFIRNCDIVKIACFAQVVNILGPIKTSREGVLREATYWPFVMLSGATSGESLRVALDCPELETSGRGPVPVIDASASYDAEADRVTLCLVHRSIGHEIAVDVQLGDLRTSGVEVEILHDRDLEARNTWQRPGRVTPVPGRAKLVSPSAIRVDLAPPSMTLLKLDVSSLDR
ncbi:MAG: Intracellular exo-alpha-(1-_5)-L-arabinofuranosidase 1 [Acidimicrobiales bacterium]|nr:MAG: alpha-N-arabinofuranosidase [Actinomycetota bacterium]MBV6508570.1 Intracellular exo-alpha-(1->5)-L-arabinofuranosidase 1 [Acidimicrobiales bacterium]RIK05120.1 MAG: alpha-N-arabinofuranosidase [Acidobacteriota bacterium]